MSTGVRVRRGEGGEQIYAMTSGGSLLLWLFDFTFDGSGLERLAELSYRAEGQDDQDPNPFMCHSTPTLSQSSLALAFLGLNSHAGPF